MQNMLWGDKINTRDYQDAIHNFKQGSVDNAESNGIYNRFGINNNLGNSVIKRFLSLVR